jgi:hypothetical protein
VSGAAGGSGRARLVPVPPGEPTPGAGPETDPERASPAARDRLLVFALAAGLVLAAAGFAVEARRAGLLAERLAATEAQLRAAESRLARYDAYLNAVRSRAGALRDRVDALLGALAADPAEGAPEE